MKKGYFGQFGGRFVPEMLMRPLEELEHAYELAKRDPLFWAEYRRLLRDFVGRPSPLYRCDNITKQLGGATIYLKREDLNHTGAHKVNNTVGQILLATRMKKKRIIAETGAGQHGVATATVAAKFGIPCFVYMGARDIARQRPNVFLMEQMGATVIPVTSGSQILKDAVSECLRDWAQNVEDTYYLLGSALGPHPYPSMVRDFQSVIGKEVKQQMKREERKLPEYCVACVGGGSNSMGLFSAFLKDASVKLIGVEAGGLGVASGKHAIRFGKKGQGGRVGIVEGYKSYFLQNNDGQIAETHSISAGLDYPGIGPQLAYLHDQGRVQFVSATDEEAINAVQTLARTEGILPAMESAHAVAYTLKLAPKLPKGTTIVCNCSGRGDKDIFIIAEALSDEGWYAFLKDKVKEHTYNAH